VNVRGWVDFRRARTPGRCADQTARQDRGVRVCRDVVDRGMNAPRRQVNLVDVYVCSRVGLGVVSVLTCGWYVRVRACWFVVDGVYVCSRVECVCTCECVCSLVNCVCSLVNCVCVGVRVCVSSSEWVTWAHLLTCASGGEDPHAGQLPASLFEPVQLLW
jgi:hypothetical protein